MAQSKRWTASSLVMQIEECYQILETPATASPDEIRKSYRTLVNVWHPDRFVGNEPLRMGAQRKLARINEAFGVLEAAGLRRIISVALVSARLQDGPEAVRVCR
jgi:DnaJ-class molecular chaperone